MSEDLDNMLREYLEEQRRNPLQDMVARVVERQTEHEAKDEERHTELVRMIDGHHYRIGTLEQAASRLEKDVEDTGTHQLQSLRAQVKRWEDLKWRALQGVVLVLLGAGVVEFIHKVSGR